MLALVVVSSGCGRPGSPSDVTEGSRPEVSEAAWGESACTANLELLEWFQTAETASDSGDDRHENSATFCVHRGEA